VQITNNILILPNNSIDVNLLLQNDGRTKDEISKTILTTGIFSLRNAQPKLLTEFVFDGLSSLYKKNNNLFKNVDAVIVVSQSYDQRIPSISTRIQSSFKIKSDAFCIDLIDGCSGYIKALSLAKLLESSGCKKILVVAGDINSMITTESDIGTKILFGDGISVSTLEAGDSLIDIRLFNNGDHNNIIACSAKDNIMNMNGFEIFRFTRNTVPALIKSYLEESSKSIESYDLLALHQASKLVVSTICNLLNYKNKFTEDFTCGKIGNLGSGSIGAWLTSIDKLEHKGKLKMLAVGFGSGISWGLASLVVDIQTNEVIYV
jgi:3-oxoacyl-[acyl-carrier-protein] synthase-3